MRRQVKQGKKQLAGRCTFCQETTIAALDAHRVVQGCDGGTYTWGNILVLCASCHRKVHSGLIKIKGRYRTSGARIVVIADIDGVEHLFYEPIFGD